VHVLTLRLTLVHHLCTVSIHSTRSPLVLWPVHCHPLNGSPLKVDSISFDQLIAFNFIDFWHLSRVSSLSRPLPRLNLLSLSHKSPFWPSRVAFCIIYCRSFASSDLPFNFISRCLHTNRTVFARLTNRRIDLFCLTIE
jgi:hypothetical protein